MKTSGPQGSAKLSFSVKGPAGSGTVYVEARKNLGEWEVRRMILADDASGRRILLKEPKAKEPGEQEEQPMGEPEDQPMEEPSV